MKKILLVFGTRPEAIKMAPIILALKERSQSMPLKVIVCVTAQHRQMLDQVLDLFSIVPDFDLDIMSENQGLAELTGKIILQVVKVIEKTDPDIVIVHGDTTTTFAASLAPYYRKKPVGHVEAGLRTHDKYNPFPEELNRQLSSVITDIHFAPTLSAKNNLIKEGIREDRIFVTGNTVIDSLLHTAALLEDDSSLSEGFFNQFRFIDKENKYFKMVLITGHRRESFGIGFENICKAIGRLAKERPHVQFVYPVHLNPHVQEPVHRLIGAYPNVHLLQPLEYLPFVFLMKNSILILTDSGGIQEEAPSLGKPVLVMREITERPEAVDAGTVKLVGTDSNSIIDNVNMLLDDPVEYDKMCFSHNPYGDGKASKRIAREIIRYISNMEGYI